MINGNDDRSNPRKLRSQIYSKVKAKENGTGVRIEPIDSDSDEEIHGSLSKARSEIKNISQINQQKFLNSKNKLITAAPLKASKSQEYGSKKEKESIKEKEKEKDKHTIEVQDLSDEESTREKVIVNDDSNSSLEIINTEYNASSTIITPSHSPTISKKIPSLSDEFKLPRGLPIIFYFFLTFKI